MGDITAKVSSIIRTVSKTENCRLTVSKATIMKKKLVDLYRQHRQDVTSQPVTTRRNLRGF